LTELDGVSSTSSLSSSSVTGGGGKMAKQPRVVVVGATNRPDLLDEALTRPGRIDRMIYVGLPDQDSREAIFRVTLDGKPCESDIDLHHIADKTLTGGYSGAEIVAICRNAALYAIEESDNILHKNNKEEPVIKMAHILRSIGMVNRQITPDMIRFYETYRSKSEGA